MAKIHEDFKAVVGKTIFSDGKGKLFFGYYKEDDSVHFVDYKTWKKLSFKDVSKGNTNKERVIKAILKNQKQFNKKVDFNMWAKKNNPSFEQTMDWFIQNGWINNINKGGIKESIDVLSVNEGKKRFNTNYGIGKSKYVVNYHDGVKKHKDGSDFFDVQIFKNQKDLEAFKKALLQKGFVAESVNEAAMNPVKKVVNAILKKHKVQAMKTYASSVRGAHNIINGGYRYEGDYFLGFYGNVPQDVIEKVGAEMKKAGVKGVEVKKGIISADFTKNGLSESVNEAKFGYKDSTASYIKNHNNEYKVAEKLNKGNEVKFYDELQKMEDKIGHPKFMIFVSNALRGYGVDMYKDPKIKNPQDAQEALFLLSK